MKERERERERSKKSANYDEKVYSFASPGDFVDKKTLHVRKKIWSILCRHIPFEEHWTVLDAGVTSEKAMQSSNFFEEFYPFKDKITALSDQDASWLEERYPGLTFVRGDGRLLPFGDNSFDLVFSSAVLEHVGSVVGQTAFVAECCRVSRKFVFLTTPNRWHPLEFHTFLPFLHWLPKSVHRKILRAAGIVDLAMEENLNLLNRKDLIKICTDLEIHDYEISDVSFLGFPSNLLLRINS